MVSYMNLVSDLTEIARRGELVSGRDEEIRLLMSIISQVQRSSPILVGEPGVGKATVAKGLAQCVVEGKVPATLRSCRFLSLQFTKLLSLDTAALFAASRHGRRPSEILEDTLKEFDVLEELVVLFIDDIHLFMDQCASSAENSRLSTVYPLMRRLGQNKLCCIGATIPAEYQKHATAFETCFRPLLVQKLSVTETAPILQVLKNNYNQHDSIMFLDSALEAAADLAERHVHRRQLPGSAIDLVDEAAAAAKSARVYRHKVMVSAKKRTQQEIAQLQRETDKASRVRLQDAKHEAQRIENLSYLVAKYQGIITQRDEIKETQAVITGLNKRLEDSISKGDDDETWEIRHQSIPEQESRMRELERRIGTAEDAFKTAEALFVDSKAKIGKLVTEIVTVENIAALVAQRAGISGSTTRDGDIEGSKGKRRSRFLRFFRRDTKQFVNTPETSLSENQTNTTLPEPSILHQQSQVTSEKSSDLAKRDATSALESAPIENPGTPSAPPPQVHVAVRRRPRTPSPPVYNPLMGEELLRIAKRGYTEQDIRNRLKRGADPNVANSNGDTSLHLAAINNSPQLIDVLVEAGARCNAQNNSGDTPLHISARLRLVFVSEKLVKRGAALDLVNFKGQTPREVGSLAGLPAAVLGRRPYLA